MGRVDRWRSAAAEGERVKVSWDQAFAWRLRRQFMEPARDAKVDAVGIVGRLCGVQAQVASSAALAVALRQNREKREAADDLERALAEGALVKTWAMRGTLHLLTPAAAQEPWPCSLRLASSGQAPGETHARARIMDAMVP